MILIDTSAWIEYIRGKNQEICDKVDNALEKQIVIIGDLIYCEIMQGLYNPKERTRISGLLLSLPQFDMVGFDLAEKSAANYRNLRKKGITIRKTIDVLIGTFCSEHDIELIHDDKDFERMKQTIHLKTL